MILMTLAVLIGASTVSVQPGGGYDLVWSAITGGNGTASGGGYTLVGGFWGEGTLLRAHRVYLPVVLRKQEEHPFGRQRWYDGAKWHAVQLIRDAALDNL